MLPDIFPCAGCGKPTHIDLLDAKDDGTGNYEILECQDCYGPGWICGCGATCQDIGGGRCRYEHADAPPPPRAR